MEVAACVGVGCLTACAVGLALGAAGTARSRAKGGRWSWGVAARSLALRISGSAPVARLVQDLLCAKALSFARAGLPAPLAGAGDEEALACLGIAGVLAAAAGWLLTGSPLGALGFPAAAAALLAQRARKAVRARRSALEAAMPEAFQSLAVALGSGRSLAQALRYVGESLAEPVAGAFSRAAFSLECGTPLGTVLGDLERALDAPGLDLVVPALEVSQRTGAPLRDLLEEAAGIVAGRIDLERKLEVKTSQARMSAQVVAAMPLVMVAFLGLFSADFRAGAATAAGVGSIAAALALDALAWRIIRRIMAVGT